MFWFDMLLFAMQKYIYIHRYDFPFVFYDIPYWLKTHLGTTYYH